MFRLVTDKETIYCIHLLRNFILKGLRFLRNVVSVAEKKRRVVSFQKGNVKTPFELITDNG